MNSSSQSKLLGFIGLFGAAFIGGAVLPVLVRTGTNMIHPFIFGWIRALFSTTLLIPLYLRHHKFNALFSKEKTPLYLWLGLGLGINITFFSFAVHYTTLIASQLIYVLIPAVVSLLAFLFIKEKLTTRKALGMFISFVGILILIVFSRSPEERLALGSVFGNFLILIAMVGYSVYVTFSRKYTQHLTVLTLITITNVALSVFLFPLALYGFFNFHSVWSLQSIGVAVIAMLANVLFICSVQLAIKSFSAATASLSSLIAPEFAALAGIIFYNEKVSVILTISLVLAIAGVLISTSAESRGLFNLFRSKIRKA